LAATVSGPATIGLLVIEQIANAPVPVRIQLPLEVKLTFPVGVLVVPGDVSVTVAEQLVVWPIVRVDSPQFTAVEVSRLLIEIVTVALVLGRC